MAYSIRGNKEGATKELDSILGEEARIAYCEECNVVKTITSGTVCEPCGGFYCRKCWRFHYCGKLTDHDGHTVKVGDEIYYADQPHREYKVTEIPGTFEKVGMCYADRLGKKKDYHLIIRPRLMILK